MPVAGQTPAGEAAPPSPAPSPSSPATSPSPPAPSPPSPAPSPSSPAPAGATHEAAPGVPSPAAAPSKLDDLGWLSGCWRGSVNQRVFREQWLPLAGGMLVGAGQVVMQGHTQDYQYLRIEMRGDDAWYVAVPGKGASIEFRLASLKHDDADDATIFTFERADSAYPQRIVYRRGAEGWLYASVEGLVSGKDRNVIYPMRRVDCETDELIKH
jgi:hypothetical protein